MKVISIDSKLSIHLYSVDNFSATKEKAVKKLEMVTASDGFGENLEEYKVSEVFSGLEGITANELIQNKVILEQFWGKKEIVRLLGPPSTQGDINRLGFDTVLVSNDKQSTFMMF